MYWIMYNYGILNFDNYKYLISLTVNYTVMKLWDADSMDSIFMHYGSRDNTFALFS